MPSAGNATTTDPASGTFVYDTTARFNSPGDIASDNTGNLYVMDRDNQVIRRISSTGEVSTLAGTYNARAGLDMDSSGNLIILSGRAEKDETGRDVIDLLRIVPGGSSTLITSYRIEPGSYNPFRISTDGQGRIYVLRAYRTEYRVDSIGPDNSSRIVYRYATYGTAGDFASDLQGNLAIGSYGPMENTSRIAIVPQSAQPAEASFPGISYRPLPQSANGNMIFHSSGEIYMADATGSAESVSAIRVMKIAPDGTVTTIFNGFPDGSTSSRPVSANAYRNIGMAVAQDGNIYLTDPYGHAIYRINPSGQASLIAGKPGEAGYAD